VGLKSFLKKAVKDPVRALTNQANSDLRDTAEYVGVRQASEPPLDMSTSEGQVLAIKRQTEAIRNSIRSLQASDLASRQQAADNARSIIDNNFRLISGGDGLRNPVTGKRSQDETSAGTLLGRTVAAKAMNSAAARSSAASPYAATQAVTPAASVAAPITAQTVLSQSRLPTYQRGNYYVNEQ
jgi:hypothetical protein